MSDLSRTDPDVQAPASRSPAQRPTFSVIICTYNRAELLPRSVGSVLRQNFEDFELIVVDDGSTDDTSSVVMRIDDPRFRHVRRENGGLSRARNTGFEHSTGRFIIYLDDDDEAYPDWLGALHAAGADDDQCAVVSCGLVEMTDAGPLVKLPRPLGPAFENYEGLFNAGTFAVHRNAFAAVGGYAEDLPSNHQTDFALRLLPLCRTRGWKVQCVRQPMMRYNVRQAEQRLRNDPTRLLEATEYLLREHQDKIARQPEMLASYYAIAGISAARLGRRVHSRRYFLRAIRTNPRRWRHVLRFAVALVPRLPERVWRGAEFHH
jgi:glycosyltransferase involved in cell wall biosynthesis